MARPNKSLQLTFDPPLNSGVRLPKNLRFEVEF